MLFPLGLLFFHRFQIANKNIYLLLSALFFGLMGTTRLQDLILTSPAIGFMFMFCLKPNLSQPYKPQARYFILFTTTVILIILLFHLPYFFFDHSDYIIQAQSNWNLNLTKSFRGLCAKPFIQSLSYLMKTFNTVSLLCFAAGLYYTANDNKRLLFFTVLWWIVPLFFFSNIITNSPRYFNILIPAIIIPISILLARMFGHKNILWTFLAPVCFLIALLPPFLNSEKLLMQRHQHAYISDYYLWVGNSTEKKAIIISCDDELFIKQYSGRLTLKKPVAIVGHLTLHDLIGFKKKLDVLLNNHQPVYITEFVLIQYDRYREFRDFMQQNYRLRQVGQMPLELWYGTPFETILCKWGLFKIEQITRSVPDHI